MKLLVATFILGLSGVFAVAQQDQKLTAAQQTERAAKVIADLASTRTQSGGVKNSPFSAEEVNESVQTLADGNRITRSTTGKIYRNSAGRVRRDMPGGTGGMLGSTYTVGPGVTILDAAGGFRYHIDEHQKTAQQSLLQVAPEVRIRAEIDAARAVELTERAKMEAERAVSVADRAKIVEKMREYERSAATTPEAVVALPAMPAMPALAPMPPVAIVSGQAGAVVTGTMTPAPSSKYETRTEDLGVQNYEGLEAKGTRTTTIIPAGAIGNERPIEIVYERWYSEELKMIVYSRRSDPRVGEQTYRLTNISRSEPDPSLFSVDGYRIIAPAKKPSTIATKPTKSPYIKNFN